MRGMELDEKGPIEPLRSCLGQTTASAQGRLDTHLDEYGLANALNIDWIHSDQKASFAAVDQDLGQIENGFFHKDGHSFFGPEGGSSADQIA